MGSMCCTAARAGSDKEVDPEAAHRVNVEDDVLTCSTSVGDRLEKNDSAASTSPSLTGISSSGSQQSPAQTPPQRAMRHRESASCLPLGRSFSSSSQPRDNALSSLFEVDADVPYRFTFWLTGQEVSGVIRAACESADAWTWLDPSRSDTPSRVASKSGHCLAPVPYPVEGDRDMLELAKLMLCQVSETVETPEVVDETEALSSCLVYILVTNPVDVTLEEQLAGLDSVLRISPSRCRNSLVILFVQSPQASAQGDEQRCVDNLAAWKLLLDDYQEVLECPLQTRGPVQLNDGPGLYKVFASIASVALRPAEEENDGGGPSDSPSTYAYSPERDGSTWDESSPRNSTALSSRTNAAPSPNLLAFAGVHGHSRGHRHPA
mmetsp:Transcript_36528/g.79992  ORF Transcript_36528/g.79992 Transcript_36528/m.79992 type:complete len:378 (-) Transcript_36528:112-1245(-)|eukprot:CAMPEP_0170602796 /NCGR_PEP_ID=MMETSP0224-20130122/18580_1 /TAXON_ID=285029 /ORGANISM="Togula jolla, Strain CCCM 725" /LENGTH=377 /DNA_ID=CAMNT_0010927655 /DNA_START=132 /DNA_END=1265 /DNA_ORIENTATION=+